MSKKVLQIILSAILCVCILSSVSVSATSDNSNQIPYNSYSYWYSTGSAYKAVYNKPLYEVERTLNYIDMGLSNQFTEITDIISGDNGKTYILDGGASETVVLDENYKVSSHFKGVKHNEEEINYKGAQGIFVDTEGYIYISDTDNARVLIVDEQGNLIKKVLLPESRLIPTNFSFKPIKTAVDSRGYMYVLSDGSYYGAILYSPLGEFLGFYGANKVKNTVSQVLVNLWNKLVMNDEKRSAMATTLPYQFTDLYIDDSDFVFTATGNTAIKKNEIQTGQIKKLSPGGTNVLLNSESIDYSDGSGTFNQDILGLSVSDDGYIYALDSAYGHIFVYDQNSMCLGVFGCGSKEGKQDGSFTTPVAITLNKDKVIVADSTLHTLTVFGITDYGTLIKKAQTLTNDGDYAGAEPFWKQALIEDKNNQLIYRGLAKANYEKEQYDEALSYAKTGFDRETYALAFEQLRNKFIENNFVLMLIGVIVIIALTVFLLKIKKKRNITLFNEKYHIAFSVMRHPGDAFDAIKRREKGSVLIATLFLILYFITYVMQYTHGGFCYVAFDASNFNSLFFLIRSAGLVLLFSICFWAVSTLSSGRGKLHEIYTVVCYCLQPMIIYNVVWIILSNIMLPSEIAFLNIAGSVVTLYAAFLIIRGLMIINDYEFGKLVGVGVLTAAGMIIVIFVGIVVLLLLQLLVGLLSTIAAEIYKIATFGG